MDWTRLLARSIIAFIMTGGGARLTGADWETVIITGLIASATATEALLARSASPTGRLSEPPR